MSLGKRHLWAWLLVLAVVFFACGEDTDTSDGNGDDLVGKKGVYVINEGLFGKGQASLTFYDVETSTATNFVFKNTNGRELGDTANDIVVSGKTAWIVLQGSNTIEAIEAGTHVSIGTISLDAGSAPYALTIDETGTKGYVPLAQANALAEIDLGAMQVTKVVEVGSSPTDVALANGKAYVANSGFGTGTTVAVVDLASFTVKQVIEVGDNPGSVIASGGKVVVLCGGFWDDFTTPDVDEGTAGSIVVIDPTTDAVTNSIPLDSGGASRLELGKDGKAYFLVGGNISEFDVASEALTVNYIVASDHDVLGFYGLSANPKDGRIYATDAKDFQTPGEVLVFEADGTFVTRFGADIIPRTAGFVE